MEEETNKHVHLGFNYMYFRKPGHDGLRPKIEKLHFKTKQKP